MNLFYVRDIGFVSGFYLPNVFLQITHSIAPFVMFGLFIKKESYYTLKPAKSVLTNTGVEKSS